MNKDIKIIKGLLMHHGAVHSRHYESEKLQNDGSIIKWRIVRSTPKPQFKEGKKMFLRNSGSQG